MRDNTTMELLGELKFPNDQLVVARGGLGGMGNAATKVNKGGKITCTPPQGGERRWLKLDLNLVADIGLVGVPNAGKSTLLDALTNARPKIAAYPFTTIVPNLGVCEMSGSTMTMSSVDHQHNKYKYEAAIPNVTDSADSYTEEVETATQLSAKKPQLQALLGGIEGESMIIADIPGLLEGAHRGVGLGRGFLRHIERCKMIIHVINGEAVDPVGDFVAINKELHMFSPILAAKPQIVVLNKIDLPHVMINRESIMRDLQQKMPHTRLLAISAASRIGVSDLTMRTWSFLKKIERGLQETSKDKNLPKEEVKLNELHEEYVEN